MQNSGPAAHTGRSHEVRFIALPLTVSVRTEQNRTAAHCNGRLKAGLPSCSSSDGPKKQEDVGLGGALSGLIRGRILGHVVSSDGTYGVTGRDTWCHQTGHVVSSDGTCGVIGRDTWCHQTGHVVSSDGTCGVIGRDIWCHWTGHVVSSDRTCGVIRRDTWCYQTGHVVSSDGGTRWRSWLNNCATSCEVAGSIPDGVIGIFHSHNPSGRTVVSNRNEYKEYFLGVKATGA
jgi:hypothetical protein